MYWEVWKIPHWRYLSPKPGAEETNQAATRTVRKREVNFRTPMTQDLPESRISRLRAHTRTLPRYLASRLADHHVPRSVQPRGRCRASGRFPSWSTHMISPPPWQATRPPMRRHRSKAKKRHLRQTREPALHQQSRRSRRPMTSWQTSQLSRPQRKGRWARRMTGNPKARL